MGILRQFQLDFIVLFNLDLIQLTSIGSDNDLVLV